MSIRRRRNEVEKARLLEAGVVDSNVLLHRIEVAPGVRSCLVLTRGRGKSPVCLTVFGQEISEGEEGGGWVGNRIKPFLGTLTDGGGVKRILEIRNCGSGDGKLRRLRV